MLSYVIKTYLLKDYLSNDSYYPNWDWIVVFLHHPMYSSIPNLYSMDLRSLLQPTFDLYGVDLVINGHKHVYERTNPVTFNNTITDNENCSYDDLNGQIYLTVGTGGHSHHQFKQKQSWSVVQNHNDFGFLNLKILVRWYLLF